MQDVPEQLRINIGNTYDLHQDITDPKVVDEHVQWIKKQGQLVFFVEDHTCCDFLLSPELNFFVRLSLFNSCPCLSLLFWFLGPRLENRQSSPRRSDGLSLCVVGILPLAWLFSFDAATLSFHSKLRHQDSLMFVCQSPGVSAAGRIQHINLSGMFIMYHWATTIH